MIGEILVVLILIIYLMILLIFGLIGLSVIFEKNNFLKKIKKYFGLK